MNVNAYLMSIIRKNSVTANYRLALQKKVRPIYNDIRRWAGEHLLRIIPSGSFLKGTGIKGSVDIDLLISLKHQTPNPLNEIFESLFDYFNQSHSVTRQNVSIGLTYQGIKIDLVPAKRMKNSTYPHSIYVSKFDTWTKTNIHKHVSVIKKSPHKNIILLLKIWRDLNGLEFPSFPLELAVLKALERKPSTSISRKFITVLKYLFEEFQFAKLYDPSNTNNIVSDTMSDTEKELIADAAFKSYELKYWEQIVWGLYEKTETI